VVRDSNTTLLDCNPSRDALESRRRCRSAADEDCVKGRHQSPSEGEHALDATRSRWLKNSTLRAHPKPGRALILFRISSVPLDVRFALLLDVRFAFLLHVRFAFLLDVRFALLLDRGFARLLDAGTDGVSCSRGRWGLLLGTALSIVLAPLERGLRLRSAADWHSYPGSRRSIGANGAPSVGSA
jgi:hypothetical protein